MYKKVMFILLHFAKKKSECELSGDKKLDRQNATRMHDQVLRDMPLSILLTPVVEFRFIMAHLSKLKTKV